VIKGAIDLRVTLSDKKTYPAKVVGFDEDKDVAVLKLENLESKVRPVLVGRSSTLVVGQKVFAIGNPFGLDHSLSSGVVSGLGREMQSGNTGRPIKGVIQTDASINPGNSGGVLLDSGGNLIGINTAIYSNSGTSAGVGFALPIDTISGVVEQIIKTGQVTRPILGITIANDGSMGGQKGVLVINVQPGGAAARAGIRPTARDEYGRLLLGDTIVAIDDKDVADSRDLYSVIDEHKPGDRVRVTVVRIDGSRRTLPVVLGAKISSFT